MQFTFGLPEWLVHLLRIVLGLFLVFVGMGLQANQALTPAIRAILAILGIFTILSEAWMWWRNPNEVYANGLPAWAMHLFQIFNGIVLLSLSTAWIPRQFTLPTNLAAGYLIVVGGLLSLYSLYMWWFARNNVFATAF